MKLLIILLLTTSCANYHGVREYSQITKYRVLGVKCAQGYYYSYDTNHCAREHYVNAEDNVNGVSIDLKKTYKSSPDHVIVLNKRVSPKTNAKLAAKAKIDCKVILDNINKCSLEVK